jgi:hypothetical protein
VWLPLYASPRQQPQVAPFCRTLPPFHDTQHMICTVSCRPGRRATWYPRLAHEPQRLRSIHQRRSGGAIKLGSHISFGGGGQQPSCDQEGFGDVWYQPQLQNLLQEEDLVQKELTKRLLLNQQWPCFLCCIKARYHVNGNVDFDLRCRERVA